MVDILILAVIAAFLGYRLYSVLGEDNGIQAPPETRENIHHFIGRQHAHSARRQPSPSSSASLHLSTKIHALDPDFDMDAFLQGCERAFSWVIRAFAAGDKEMLHGLLAPSVFAQFAQSIDARAPSQPAPEQSIDAIHHISPEDVIFEGDDIFVTVRFLTAQTTIIRDDQGRIEMTQQSIPHNDLWTFHRNTKSPSKLWQVVATEVAQPDED